MYNLASPQPPQKILIVDDNPTNVDLLCAQLKGAGYFLKVAYDGDQALKSVEQDPPDLILLDLMMPKVSGYHVCEQIKKSQATRLIPVIVITALKEIPDKIRALELGADYYLMKPYNKLELIARIQALLSLKKFYDNVDVNENILFTLAEVLEAKDKYTRGHSERVAKYSVKLAHFIGLPEIEQEHIRRGALLHDIGKVGVSELILNKPSKLSQEELAHIRTHPLKGCEMCRSLKSLQNSLNIIRHHHERVDGQGYPDGVHLDHISIGARIVAITDSYDAMTSDRSYRKGIPPYEAIRIFEIEMHRGQWDPELLVEWIKLIRKTEGFTREA